MSRKSEFLIAERPEGTLRVQTVNEDPEVTKQSFRDECDINNIVAHYQVTGVTRHLNLAAAQYADVSELTDYADALMMVKRAEAMFMELPARARKVFDHDPAKFLDAAHDPEKRGLLVEAGLLPEEAREVRPEAPAEAPAGPEPELE